MRRRSAPLLAAIPLLGAVAMSTNSRVASAGPPDTGRVALTTPAKIYDSRFPAQRLAADQDRAVPGTGIIDITIVDAPDEGAAVVHECGAAISDEDVVIHFEAQQTVTRKVQIPDGSAFCVFPTQSVHMLATSYGTIAAAPSSGRLQFRDAPDQVVREGVVGSAKSVAASSNVPIAVGAATPPGAEGVVYRVEAAGSPESGYLTLTPCGGTALSADLVYDARSSSNIVYLPIPYPGTTMCLTTYGGPVYVRLTVLGWLDDTGPDGDVLPPVETDALGLLDPPGFVAVTPRRVLDTRNGIGAPASRVRPDGVLALDLLHVTSDTTTAVVLNVTVTQPQSDGYVTVWPCDEDRPVASNLNFTAGQTVPNLVNVRLAGDASVCFASTADVHLLADLAGTFDLADGFASQGVTPFRLLDTRNGVGASAAIVGTDQPLVLAVGGRGGAPAGGTDAATINLTVTQPQADGYLTAWPCDAPRPTASNLNFTAGQTVPNLVTVKVSAAGTVCLASTASTHLIADLQAWYGPSAVNGYIDLTPARLLDTRTGVGVIAAKQAANAPLRLTVAGREGVPGSGADSVTMNVTVTQPDGAGYLTAWPCDQPRPTASNLNFDAGQTVPNLVTVKLAADGTVCLFSTASAHMLADVAGYSTDEPIAFWATIVTDP